MAAKGKISQAAVWVLLGLLVLALAGFGVGNMTGTVTTIGRINGQDITTNEYFRGLRQEIDAASRERGRALSFAEAEATGLQMQVQQQLVTTARLDAETAALGLSVGDARLAREIREMQAFQSTAGFDRTLYSLALERNGWSEKEFEARFRKDIARGIVQAAVASGHPGSDLVADTLLAHLLERRSFSILRFEPSDLDAPPPEPDRATLEAHHAANPAAFTRPPMRRITYAALLPEALLETIEVDEEPLRQLYQTRLNEYVQPERRLVDRLVYPTEAEAEAARNRIDAGLMSFDDAVAARGLNTADVDLGDATQADLGEAGAVIFAMPEPGVVGPLPSPVGPALYRMNGIFPASEISFEEARDELVDEFARDLARRRIADLIDDFDDLLAGGATLEELADEPGARVNTIELAADAAVGMAAYPSFRERATRLTMRDFPEMFALEDGAIAAMRLDAELPETLPPFDEVADAVARHWRAEAVRGALRSQAEAALDTVRAGAPLASQGIVEVHAAMPREARIDRTPEAFMDLVFGLDEASIGLVALGDFIALLRVDEVLEAETPQTEIDAFRAILMLTQGQQIGADAFALFSRALIDTADIRLNQTAITAVHSSLR